MDDKNNNTDNPEEVLNQNQASIPSDNPSTVASQSINPTEQSKSEQSQTQAVETSQNKISTSPTTVSPDLHKKKNLFSLPIIIVLIVITFLGGLFLVALYYQNQLQKVQQTKTAQETAVAVVALPKTLVIGTDATAPPMESMNKQGGLVGYDIDLGVRIANELGVKAEIKNIPWVDIFKSLEEKKIDMIISSVTINDERKKIYIFSDPYINAGQVIVSRKDNQIKTVSELRGKKISVQKGTTNEKEALNYTSANMVLSIDSFVDAAKALSEGKADAMISDLTMAKGFISQYDNLKITSDPFTNDYYGVVFRKDQPDLQKKVNEALTALRVNGIITDLKQKWLD